MALTQEQLTLRRTGIGGSDIASLVSGLSPWGSPITVWRSKMGEVITKMTDQMLIGTHMEPGVVTLYSYLNNRRVTSPGTLRHKTHSIVLATPDGISYDAQNEDEPPVVLEVKCPHFRNAPKWKNLEPGEIPPYYWPQLTWEMAVAGLKTAHLCAYFGELPTVHEVHFIPDMFDGLLEIASRFWRDYVLTEREPPVDATEAYAEYLTDKFPTPKIREFKIATDADLHWVRQLHLARQLKTDAETMEREARNELIASIGDYSGLEGVFGQIAYNKNKDSEVVNYKAIVEELRPKLTDPTIIPRHTKTKTGSRPFAPRFNEEFFIT